MRLGLCGCFLLLPILGCALDLSVESASSIQCVTTSDCPSDWVCVEPVGRCAQRGDPCVQESDGRWFAATNGNDCPDGVCIDGTCRLSICGDGFADQAEGESCDNGLGNSDFNPGACRSTCVLAQCGDGVIDWPNGEVCDDGNIEGGDGCASDCTRLERCGDGIIQADLGEACDDGNAGGGDGCSPLCLVEEGFTCTSTNPSACEGCGNGIVERGETCDDGNLAVDDGCPSGPGGTCELARCGDGFIETQSLTPEQCDDGNDDLNDDCPSGPQGTCEPARCGDGILNESGTAPEQCDDADNDDGDGCTSTCLVEPGFTCVPGTDGVSICAGCGNGMLEATEDCDDANLLAGDGCSVLCTFEPGWLCSEPPGQPTMCASVCGDGIRVTGELCDDGNVGHPSMPLNPMNSDTNPDACRTDCTPPRCGDNVTDSLETCDDGNDLTDDDCPSGPSGTCQPSACGDGFLDLEGPGVEVCDDGNMSSSDDCLAVTCVLNTCGDGFRNVDGGVLASLEECDDGGSNSDTIPNACRTDCRTAFCGDGVQDSGEDCDDGNGNEQDYCDNNCNIIGSCGDSILQSNEDCDTGPVGSRAGDDLLCSPTCQAEDFAACDGEGPGTCFAATYVDENASGDGSSWVNALPSVPEFIDEDERVLVRPGVYTSSASISSPAFEIAGGRIYGFANSARNFVRRTTSAGSVVLSGDKNGDDGGFFSNRDDNNYTVTLVRSPSGTSPRGWLDSISVRGGSNGTDYSCIDFGSTGPKPGGAGIVVSGGGNLHDVIVTDNGRTDGSAPLFGGGILVCNAATDITDVDVSDNAATNGGGIGITTTGSRPVLLQRVNIVDNTATTAGGGLSARNAGADPSAVIEIFESLVETNSATASAAMFLSGVNYDMRNVVINNNNATGSGTGGIEVLCLTGSSPTLQRMNHITMRANSGGIGVNHLRINASCTIPIVRNSIFAGSGTAIDSGLLSITYSRVPTGSAYLVNAGMTSAVPSLQSNHEPNASSAMIDAGNGGLIFQPTIDFYGNPREVDQPGVIDTGGGPPPHPDLGAVEVQ